MKYALSLLALIAIFSFYGCPKSQPVDPPVDTYEEIKIGNQIWMLNNLDIDHYRNGDPIPKIRDTIKWSKLTTGAWCYFENSNCLGKIYGKLYNWYAVNDPRGLAPKAWHVASYEEWVELIQYLGGDSIAGGKLKESGTSHWKSPNGGATNESGFSAVPGGMLDAYSGVFSFWGYIGCWWSATESNATLARIWQLSCNDASIFGYGSSKVNGFSVRCVKD